MPPPETDVTPHDAALRGGARAPALLAAIVFVSLALKLFLVWLVAAMPCSHDQCDYLDLAAGIAAGLGLQPHDGYLWPPGYVHVLAAFRAAFGDALTPIRIFQVLLSTASVPLVFLLARRAGGWRAGLVGAAVFAFEPTLVAFTHLLWPETLFILLLLGAFCCLTAGPPLSPRLAAAAGLLLGGAALVRGTALYLAPLAALWILFDRGPGPTTLEAQRPAVDRRMRRLAALCLLLATLAPILPWTVRNAYAYGRFLLVDAATGRNLYIGTNVPPPSNWDLGFEERRRVHGGRPRCTGDNVVDVDRCEIRNALAFMAAHPGLMMRRVPLKLADLLNPSSFLIRHVRLGKYPYTFASWLARGITLLTALSWMGIAVAGLAGLVLLPSTAQSRLIACLVAYHLLVHGVTFGLTRFRLPFVPFLIVAGAPLLARPASALSPPPAVARWVCFAAGLLLLLGAWGSRWPMLF